jgi:hypothetical protein
VADLKKSLLFLSFCAKPKPEVKSPDDEAFYSINGAFCRRVEALDKNLGKAAKGFRRTVRARRDRSGETLPFKPA